MANLNRVFLIGRLTRDPEMRYTQSGTAICNFGLAVNRTWKGQDGQKQEDTTFVDITAWGRTGELAQQYLAKGRQVFLEGYLKFEQWEDRNGGGKRSKLSVTAENLQFLDSRTTEREPQEAAPTAQQYSGPDYGGGGDDIPF